MKTNVQETSIIAHRKARRSGLLKTHRETILDLLRAHPSKDWTRSELSDVLNIRINSICGVVFTMIHDDGDLVELEKRECRSTGELARPVKLNQGEA